MAVAPVPSPLAALFLLEPASGAPIACRTAAMRYSSGCSRCNNCVGRQRRGPAGRVLPAPLTAELLLLLPHQVEFGAFSG